jgi:hypothetical protein
LNALIPHPSDFAHPSKIHGQAHVGRVMIHAFRLIEATGMTDEASRLWGAVYLHDLARTHDGFDEVHGMHAVMRVNESTDLQERLIARGVQSDDPSMLLAVMMHCLPDDHSAFGGKPVWPLLAMLKDVNALDRVRFGDLDASYLRFEQTRGMIKFAEDLYSQSHRRVKEGPNFFMDLLKVAERILGKPVPVPASVWGATISRAKGRAKPNVPAASAPAGKGKAGSKGAPPAPAPKLGAKGAPAKLAPAKPAPAKPGAKPPKAAAKAPAAPPAKPKRKAAR